VEDRGGCVLGCAAVMILIWLVFVVAEFGLILAGIRFLIHAG